MPRQIDRRVILASFLRDVWSDGKAELCANYLAASYTIHHDPGDPWDGRTLDLAGFEDRVRRSREPFPDQRFDVQRMFDDGNAIAVIWLWSATHKGDIAGFPATGKPIHMSGATVYYFDDNDRLTGHWQVTDRLGVYQQLQRARAS